MELTSEITSFSSNSLDLNLFEPPATYTEIKADAEQVLEGKRKR
jgi:hypothetical protein